MRKVLFCLFCVFLSGVVDAAQTGRMGRNVVGLEKSADSSYRATVDKVNVGVSVEDKEYPAAAVWNKELSNVVVDKPTVTVDPELEKIKKQREICISNNIGVSNTFVWAAKNSNTDSYVNMIEDIENPKNNTCYVKVDLKTSDNRIDISDIKSKYFEMGRSVTCGAWVDEEILKDRILDGKKKARNLGVVASVVGGAGVGVGAMELFGNKLIGGKVMGQKSLEGQELILSQIKVLEKENKTEYNRVVKALEDLEQGCREAGSLGDHNLSDCDEQINPFIGLLEKLK